MASNLGMLLYPNVQPIDVIGPWEVFSTWKTVLNAPVDLHLISENGSFVQCDNGIVLKADLDFDHCPQLDYLIIPGGRGRATQINNEKILAFIRKQAAHCQYIISVCTGAFLLYQAGVLKDESITTYWRALPELLALKDIHVKEERVVQSGKIWASGGLSSGIDLALAIIAQVAGKETAGQVQLLFEYFPTDTLYASLDTAATLPSYYGNQVPPHVPTYIQEYFNSKK